MVGLFARARVHAHCRCHAVIMHAQPCLALAWRYNDGVSTSTHVKQQDRSINRFSPCRHQFCACCACCRHSVSCASAHPRILRLALSMSTCLGRCTRGTGQRQHARTRSRATSSCITARTRNLSAEHVSWLFFWGGVSISVVIWPRNSSAAHQGKFQLLPTGKG